MTEEDPDNWWTPDPLYQDRTNYYKVYPQLDVCADEFNTKCIYYFDKEVDALKTDWMVNNFTIITKRKQPQIDIGEREPLLYYPDIWFNAPGKHIQAFVDKACEQWQKFNMNIIGLIPINTIANTAFEKYWNMMKNNKIRIDPLFGIRPRFLDGRLNREKPLEPKFGSRNGYMSILFPKH